MSSVPQGEATSSHNHTAAVAVNDDSEEHHRDKEHHASLHPHMSDAARAVMAIREGAGGHNHQQTHVADVVKAVVALKKVRKERAKQKPGKHRFAIRRGLIADFFFPHYAHREHIDDMEMAQRVHHEDEPKRTWQGYVVDFLQSTKVQTILLLLLVLDVLVVMTEIMISQHEQCFVELDHHCHVNSTAHVSSNETLDPHETTLDPHETTLDPLGVESSSGGSDGSSSGSGESHHGTSEGEHGEEPELVRHGNIYFPPPGCGVEVIKELSPALERAEKSLMWISRSILFIFAAELLTLFITLGKKFFTVPYVLDTVVIFTSIALEFALHGIAQEETGLIILLRCWRFLRILHGFGLTVHDVDEREHEREKQQEEQEEEHNHEGTEPFTHHHKEEGAANDEAAAAKKEEEADPR